MLHNEKEVTFESLFIPFTNKKAIIFIIIIGFVVYFNSLFNGFVWDDWRLIINNPTAHSFGGCFKFFFELKTNQDLTFYRPLPLCTYSLVYNLFGSNVFYYHLIQVILHISNTCLLFTLFCRYFTKKLSFVLALIFLVHPLNAESVNYIAALQEPLYFFFGLLAFMTLNTSNFKFKQLIFGSFYLLCSLFSKESGVLFLVMVIFYHIFSKRENKFRLIASLSMVSCVYIIARLLFASGHGFNDLYANLYVPIARVPLYIRLQTIPNILFFYAKSFFYPDHLAIAQYWVVKSLTLNKFILPLFFDVLFLLAIIFLGIYLHRYNKIGIKIYKFFCVWLLAGISIHLQIIPLDMTVSDHYFYFGMVGILGLLGITYANLTFKILKDSKFLTVLIIVIILTLSIRTIIRNTNWVNMLTLYSHDISYSDSSGVLAFNLGMQLFDIGNYPEAGKYLNKSVELSPDNWINWNSLGAYYVYRKKYSLAENDFKQSIKYNGNYLPAYENYASTLASRGDPHLAKDFIVKSLKRFPKDGELWSSLALAYYRLNYRSDAIYAAKQAYAFSPTQQNKLLYLGLSGNVPFIIDTNTAQLNEH